MDMRKSGGNPNTTGTHGLTLTDATVWMWPTPKATDAKTASPGDAARKSPGLRAVTITTGGTDGSPRADLNPFFVATLMGLPMDWLTLSTSAVTASCLRQLHTPSDSYLTAAGGS